MIPAHAIDKHATWSLLNATMNRLPKAHPDDNIAHVPGISGSATHRQRMIAKHDGVPYNLHSEPAKLPPAEGKVKEPIEPQHSKEVIADVKESEKAVKEPKDNIAVPLSGDASEVAKSLSDEVDEDTSEECECECHMCPIENGKYVPHECTDGPWCIDGKFDRAKVYTKAHQIKDKKGYSWNDALKEAWIIAKASK